MFNDDKGLMDLQRIHHIAYEIRQFLFLYTLYGTVHTPFTELTLLIRVLTEKL